MLIDPPYDCSSYLDRSVTRYVFSHTIQLVLDPSCGTGHLLSVLICTEAKIINMNIEKYYKEGVLFDDFDSIIKKPLLDSDESISKHRKKIEQFRNMNLLKGLLTSSGYKQIMLKAVNGITPTLLVAFSKASKKRKWDAIVHFFEYDYVIERFWNCPKRYLRMLKRHKAVIGPDFSVECCLPDEVNEWNLFVNRALSYIMQCFGITVIPNLSVCPVKYYDKVFNCLEPGGIYAISNVRAFGDYFSRHEWYKYVHEALRRLRPEALIIYGNKMSVSDVKVYYFENENIKSLRNGKSNAA